MYKKIITLIFITTFVHATPTLEEGMEYQKNEQFDQAIACYKEIVSAEPQNIHAYFNLGCSYLALGNKEKTFHAFDRILAYNPHLLPVLYNKAYSYKTFGFLESAIELYKKI